MLKNSHVRRAMVCPVAALIMLAVSAPPGWATQGPPQLPPQPSAELIDIPLVPRKEWQQKKSCQPLEYVPESMPSNPLQGTLDDVHTRFTGQTTGEGVVVAVIDTGINPNPRLPPIESGGDLIDTNDRGLSDCDGHGQIVASIIAGKPSDQDEYVGIAPNIDRLISIRLDSRKYDTPVDREERQQNGIEDIANSIIHAVALKARIINISSVVCLNNREYQTISLDKLGQAVRYAEDNDSLIVASSGNKTENQQNCDNNTSENNIHDAWASLKSFSIPSVFSPTILSVTSTGVKSLGTTAPYAAPGPWISISAPGSDITALGRAGQIVNRYRDLRNGDLQTINGTSFAAPYVSGQAALLLSAHPSMSVQQLRRTIIDTAINGWTTVSSNKIGYADISGSLTKHASDTTATQIPEKVLTEAFPDREHNPYRTAVIMFAIAIAAMICIPKIMRKRER